jgi:hypothetical protein
MTRLLSVFYLSFLRSGPRLDHIHTPLSIKSESLIRGPMVRSDPVQRGPTDPAHGSYGPIP